MELCTSPLTSMTNTNYDKKFNKERSSVVNYGVAIYDLWGRILSNGEDSGTEWGNYVKIPEKKIPDMECLGITIDLRRTENLNKLKKMSKFCDDWNGTGGKAFSAKAISVFKSLIEFLPIQPEIAPTGRNSLLMQYELDDKSMLAFEVGEEQAEMVYIPREDYSMAKSETFTENICQNIKIQVEKFYGPE